MNSTIAIITIQAHECREERGAGDRGVPEDPEIVVGGGDAEVDRGQQADLAAAAQHQGHRDHQSLELPAAEDADQPAGPAAPVPRPPLRVPRTPPPTQKKNYPKCYEFARLIKHFSQWDYEFEFVFGVAVDRDLEQLGLYMRLREVVLRSEFNRAKKDLLSGISAELGTVGGTQRSGRR